MLKIVEKNPYRLLGVYANSPKRDILANKGKATAFLNVGRTVEYPLDLKGIMPTIARTTDLFNDAESHLAIAKEQILYAQFWFLKMTPIDDVAFNHLTTGNIKKAKEMWSKQDSLSSLQNRIVCSLIEDNPKQALKVAENLYNQFGKEYVKSIDANCTLQLNETELLHQFIDHLAVEVDLQSFLQSTLHAATKKYISSKVIEPLLKRITFEIDKTKKVDSNDADARKEAGQQLIATTKETLQQLKDILSTEDSQYQMIANKLGSEILQCSIDYFNNSDDDDAPYTAMEMLKYAQSVVVGNLTTDRCNENIQILQKIINELPPVEVKAEDKAIKKALAMYKLLPSNITHAVTLLNNTKPHLLTIKRKLGGTNSYYLMISTLIVENALHNVIKEVNNAQDKLRFQSSARKGLDSRRLALQQPWMDKDFQEARKSRESTFQAAWETLNIMHGFDMVEEFKTRYNQNRSTLQDMCYNIGVPTPPPPRSFMEVITDFAKDFIEEHRTLSIVIGVIIVLFILIGLIFGAVGFAFLFGGIAFFSLCGFYYGNGAKFRLIALAVAFVFGLLCFLIVNLFGLL